MNQPEAYHWIILLCCVTVGLIQGAYDLIHRVDEEDCEGRFYHIARITRFPLSLGTVVFAVLIPLRQFWAIDGLIVCFIISIFLHLFILRPAPKGHPIVKWLGTGRVMNLWGAFIFFALGVPTLLLIWLRQVFTTN